MSKIAFTEIEQDAKCVYNCGDLVIFNQSESVLICDIKKNKMLIYAGAFRAQIDKYLMIYNNATSSMRYIVAEDFSQLFFLDGMSDTENDNDTHTFFEYDTVIFIAKMNKKRDRAIIAAKYKHQTEFKVESFELLGQDSSSYEQLFYALVRIQHSYSSRRVYVSNIHISDGCELLAIIPRDKAIDKIRASIPPPVFAKGRFCDVYVK
jgi:hypothetical protein